MVLFALLALWIFIVTLFVLLAFFIIQMLADAAQHQFSNANEKSIWIAAIALTFGLGAVVYYLSVKKKTA